ncbi:MAG: cation:proton antiporter [archaeon]
MDAFILLTYVAVILMLGVLCNIIAKALRIPPSLILLLLGIFLGSTSYEGKPLIELDPMFVIGLGTLAMVMLIFDSASRFKLKEMHQAAVPALKLIDDFLSLTVLFLTPLTAWLFFGGINLMSILFAVLFSVLMIETDLGSVLALFKEFSRDKARRVLSFLEAEAEFNTAVITILPFIVLTFINDLNFGANNEPLEIMSQLPVLFYQLAIGVGVGLVLGLVLLKLMRKKYSMQLSPIALVTITIIAFLFTERIGGNGALAVATMGFLFGNIYVTGKPQLEEFSTMLTNAVEILMFVMAGIIIKLPLTGEFITKSMLLFLVLVVIRMIAVHISLKKEDYTHKEKMFIAFNMPKGFAVIVVAVVLSAYDHPQFITIILQLAIAFTVYSLLLSTILDLHFRKFMEYIIPSAPQSPSSRAIGIPVIAPRDETVKEQAKPTPTKSKKLKAKRKAVQKKRAVPAKRKKKPANPAKSNQRKKNKKKISINKKKR